MIELLAAALIIMVFFGIVGGAAILFIHSLERRS